MVDPTMLSAASTVLGNVLKPAGAGPSNAQNFTDQVFDTSQWTVATGGSKADAVASKGVELSQWVILGIAAVVVVGWIKTRK